jgi:hypothetical protein
MTLDDATIDDAVHAYMSAAAAYNATSWYEEPDIVFLPQEP